MPASTVAEIDAFYLVRADRCTLVGQSAHRLGTRYDTRSRYRKPAKREGGEPATRVPGLADWLGATRHLETQMAGRIHRAAHARTHALPRASNGAKWLAYSEYSQEYSEYSQGVL